MVRTNHFTLHSDRGPRLIIISPVLFQSKEKPSLLPPIKAYLYEHLILEEFWAHAADYKIEIPKEFERKDLVIKHDQDFEKAYLGYLISSGDENLQWKWEGAVINLSKIEIKQIEDFFNSYPENDEEMVPVKS